MSQINPQIKSQPTHANGFQPMAMTMGDVAGIGPEIIARLLVEHPQEMRGVCVVGPAQALEQALRTQGGHHRIRPVEKWGEVAACAADEVALWPVVGWHSGLRLGCVQADAGRMAAQSIRLAAQAALRGEVAAMVTAPIHKEALHLAGEPYPGHTELLQHEAAVHQACNLENMPVRMMLANPELRVVLVSIHVGLRQALDAVQFDAVLQTICIAHDSLSRLQSFAQRPVRIAVAGLNPHAGEGGLFGREEIDTIAPAVARARELGMQVSGPYAPDTVFMRARRGEFDVVVAMYHDQGLIPVKYLGVDEGVNVTLGLPLIRTSPDHGTAFDIAGQGVADPTSLRKALFMAKELAAWTPPAAPHRLDGTV